MPRPKRPPPPPLSRKEPSHPPRRQKTAAPALALAPAPVPSGGAGGGDLTRAFGRCRSLLDDLLRHDDGWVFAAPVDARALGLRDYYTVIRDPMDLGTVLRRLERRRYADPRDFAADVRLTFRNAMSYNNPGDPVYESAAELSKIFEPRWNSIRAELPPPVPTKAERILRFADELNQMPVGMERMLARTMMDRGMDAPEKNGKVEVDLCHADAATMDELERLVTAHHDALDADVDALMQEP